MSRNRIAENLGMARGPSCLGSRTSLGARTALRSRGRLRSWWASLARAGPVQAPAPRWTVPPSSGKPPGLLEDRRAADGGLDRATPGVGPGRGQGLRDSAERTLRCSGGGGWGTRAQKPYGSGHSVCQPGCLPACLGPERAGGRSVSGQSLCPGREPSSPLPTSQNSRLGPDPSLPSAPS